MDVWTLNKRGAIRRIRIIAQRLFKKGRINPQGKLL